METLKLIIKCIITIGGLSATAGTAIAKTEQTTISAALLPHDQQIINKHIQNLTLTLVMFIFLFIGGLVPNKFAALDDFISTTISTEKAATDSSKDTQSDNSTEKNNNITTTKNTVDMDANDNTKDIEVAISGSSEAKSSTNTLAITILVICIIILFVLPIVISLSLYIKDKKGDFEDNKRDYFNIGFYLFVFLFTLLLNTFLGLTIATKDLLLYDLFVSLAGAIFVRLLFSALYPQIDYQCGNITTKIDGKDYYCFERVDNNLIVGDKKYVSDCSEFRLIEIKEDTVFNQTPLGKNKFKLKKSNITYNNINEGNRDEYLRKVIDYCQKDPSIILNENATISLNYSPDTNTIDCVINEARHQVQLSQNKYKGKLPFIN